MDLIKGFQKATSIKNPMDLYNTFVGQMDINFRKIESSFDDLFSLIGSIKSMKVGQVNMDGAGSATVNEPSVKSNSLIFLCSKIDGTPGFLRVSSIIDGSNFVITSSSGIDSSTVSYLVININ